MYRPGIFSGTISSADSRLKRGILLTKGKWISLATLWSNWINSLVCLLKYQFYSFFFEGYVEKDKDIRRCLWSTDSSKNSVRWDKTKVHSPEQQSWLNPVSNKQSDFGPIALVMTMFCSDLQSPRKVSKTRCVCSCRSRLRRETCQSWLSLEVYDDHSYGYWKYWLMKWNLCTLDVHSVSLVRYASPLDQDP